MLCVFFFDLILIWFFYKPLRFSPELGEAIFIIAFILLGLTYFGAGFMRTFGLRKLIGIVFSTGLITVHAEENSSNKWRIFAGGGESKDSNHVVILRAGVQRDFGWKWLSCRWGRLTGFHEASINTWRSGGDSIGALAYSPVLTYRFNGRHIEPYIEGGIGLTLLSETRIKSRDMSSYYQFEDRIGVGLRLGEARRHDINFRYMHYSNAGFRLPNDRLDIYMLSYSFGF